MRTLERNLLKQHEIDATFFVPGYTAELHPPVIDSLLEHGHEIAHHGYLHKRNHLISVEELREEIERGTEALVAAGAPKPVGYRSPAWEMTPETFDLLKEYDFLYDSSCMGDDRPYVERWESGEILELPVHWSLDDWPHFGWSIDTGGNVADPGELFSSWAEEYRCARSEGRSIVFTMHPEVIGRAHRLAALERLIEVMVSDGDVWFASLEKVARHVQADVMGTVQR